MRDLFKLTALAFLLSWAAGVFSIVGVCSTFALLWLGWKTYRIGPMRVLRLSNAVKVLRFAYDFLFDLAVSNLVLAWDVLTPEDRHRVNMILVPVDDLTDLEIALLSLRITLTPGTLACDVTEGGRYLLVHAMYLTEADVGDRLRRPIDILKGRIRYAREFR